MTSALDGHWALILGASSGFGAATAKALAKDGLNIVGVHLDRKGTLPLVEQVIRDIQATGRKAVFINANAADAAKRADVIAAIGQELASSNPRRSVKVLLHSLAFGALRPYVAGDGDEITVDQMNMTLDVMANSLVYWAHDLVKAGLMGEGGRIFAMTSSGGTRVWPHYGAVSAAKAALESHIRQLALELAPHKITANAIRAGVTDTPALRKIPGNEQMMEFSKARNPYKRLTTPEDVAQAIAVLSDPRTHWLTGNTIGVDGGEDIVG